MRSVRIEIRQSDLKRCQRDNVPASMVRQRLIQAGAPEGFNMADVTRHDGGGVIAYTWREPEYRIEHVRLPTVAVTCPSCGNRRSQYPDEECIYCRAVMI